MGRPFGCEQWVGKVFEMWNVEWGQKTEAEMLKKKKQVLEGDKI